ncbi:hypothetical protein NIB75_07345 [Bacteroides uniformis]|nr:hypothetical protein [Bacteroides uniformis]
MNNQAAKTVSDALLGLDFMNVEIGGMVYTIKPPTIKIICRVIHHFSNIGMTGDNVMEAIKELPRNCWRYAERHFLFHLWQ